MPRALVTGGSGFVGQWMCSALLQEGWEVTATTIGARPDPGTLTPEESARVTWRAIDLRPGADRRTVLGLLDREPPDAVVHLAAVAFVPAAGEDPMRALETNVGATVRLLDALRELRAAGTADPVTLVVGSAEQYGRHDEAALPLTERHECRPRTFYAATKAAQEHFALAAARANGLRVVCTRSFNHAGPGQAARFLLPALVGRVQEVRAGRAREVAIGNRGTVRDILHVSDVVEAYRALLAHGRTEEVYNVCSGEGISVEALAHEVLAHVGVACPVVSDPALQRAVDVPHLVGDPAKLRAATGWVPRRTRAHIIDDLLDAAA